MPYCPYRACWQRLILMKLKDRQKVEIVSMDMWNPYRAAVKAVLPQARIVVDKFHVVRMANDALERVDRKSTRLNSSHVRISYAVFCLKKKKLAEHPACWLDGVP